MFHVCVCGFFLHRFNGNHKQLKALFFLRMLVTMLIVDAMFVSVSVRVCVFAVRWML